MKFYEKFKTKLTNNQLTREVDKIRKKSFREKGFTIVELIVVIAIIAGFAVVGSAGFSSIRENQRQANHENITATIASSLQHFATDYDLVGVLDSSGNEKLDLGTVLETNNEITVNAKRNVFDTNDNDVVSLLVPITDDHPLVTMGYLTDAPKNPWGNSAKFGSDDNFSYVYVADFKVSKKRLNNPDGTTDQQTEIQPQVRLMKMEGDTLKRDDFVVVSNGKTYRTVEDKQQILNKNETYAKSLQKYGYDFEAKTSGLDKDKEPLSKAVIEGSKVK